MRTGGAIVSLSVVAAVVILVAVVHSPAAAGDAPSFLITEADPHDEGFSVVNVSDSNRDIGGYTFTDGEGTLTMPSRHTMAPGERLTLVSRDNGSWFASRSGVFTYADAGAEKQGRFTLADSSDMIVMRDSSGQVVDQVCWGDSEAPEGWSGDPASIRSRSYLLRSGHADTNSADDWRCTRPGWTDSVFGESFPASVTPFSFPESDGVPVLEAISSARTYVDVSIYLLSSANAVSLLIDLEERGVDVRVLLEAQPLGVDVSRELSLMKSLESSGGEVRLINGTDADQRYTFLHNKYAVVDGDTVVITSENWTEGNLGQGTGNRGWGAVIESEGYARFMERTFASDYSLDWGDVQTLSAAYPGLRPYSGNLNYDEPAPFAGKTYEAEVRPAMSPDDSADAMRSLIANATERVWAEEMDIGSNLVSVSRDGPVAWMQSAAENGADARLVLDASQASGEDHGRYVNMISGTTGIKAVAVDGGEDFQLIHNKGIVIDGSVWLGSVNWTSTSFGSNRESAAVIDSRGVSDFFAGLFSEDYGVNIHTVEEDGLSLTVRTIDSGSGRKALCTVSGPEGSTYRWSMDGETRTGTLPSAVFDVGGGEHTVTVELAGTEVSDTETFSVPSGGPSSVCIIYLTAALVIVVGAASFFVRRRAEWRRAQRRSGTSGRRTRTWRTR